MEMVKLVKGDRVIERPKVDYENNKNIWGISGWTLDEGKPKAPKVEPKPVMEEAPKPKKTTKKAE